MRLTDVTTAPGHPESGDDLIKCKKHVAFFANIGELTQPRSLSVHPQSISMTTVGMYMEHEDCTIPSLGLVACTGCTITIASSSACSLIRSKAAEELYGSTAVAPSTLGGRPSDTGAPIG
eukprot:SAG31_NODE_403_length_16150_cov_12.566588_8_plen_120_part_00